MTMTDDPILFAELVQKILVGNYEPIMCIFGKIFTINLHNVQMLFMFWIKNTFSECLALLDKHAGPQWKTFWRRFPGPQARWAFGGSYPQILFVPPKIMLCLENFVLNMW